MSILMSNSSLLPSQLTRYLWLNWVAKTRA